MIFVFFWKRLMQIFLNKRLLSNTFWRLLTTFQSISRAWLACSRNLLQQRACAEHWLRTQGTGGGILPIHYSEKYDLLNSIDLLLCFRYQMSLTMYIMYWREAEKLGSLITKLDQIHNRITIIQTEASATDGELNDQLNPQWVLAIAACTLLVFEKILRSYSQSRLNNWSKFWYTSMYFALFSEVHYDWFVRGIDHVSESRFHFISSYQGNCWICSELTVRLLLRLRLSEPSLPSADWSYCPKNESYKSNKSPVVT